MHHNIGPLEILGVHIQASSSPEKESLWEKLAESYLTSKKQPKSRGALRNKVGGRSERGGNVNNKRANYNNSHTAIIFD